MFTRTDFPLARLSQAKPLPQAIYLQQLSTSSPRYSNESHNVFLFLDSGPRLKNSLVLKA